MCWLDGEQAGGSRHARQELVVEEWFDCDLDLCLCSGFVEKRLASGCVLLETEGN